jgi:hypothetical protein
LVAAPSGVVDSVAVAQAAALVAVLAAASVVADLVAVV